MFEEFFVKLLTNDITMTTTHSKITFLITFAGNSLIYFDNMCITKIIKYILL